MTAPVRIYYNHGVRFTVGPLGVHRVGDELTLPDGRGVVRVGSLDADGAAICWRVSFLEELVERGDHPDVEDALKGLQMVRTTHGRSWLNPRQQQQVDNIVAANRRRYATT